MTAMLDAPEVHKVVDGKPVPLKVQLRQYPGSVRRAGEAIYIDGDPWIIADIDPLRYEGYFLDTGFLVEPCVVIVTVERYTE